MTQNRADNGFWRQMRASLPRNVLALGAVSFLTDSSSEMMMWTLPFYIALLGGGLVWVGLVEGLRETTASLVTVGSGWLSDRIRKRKVLVAAGYGLSMIVKPILALAEAPWHVLVLTSAERVGKGVRGAPRDALVAGAVASENLGKAFSFHRMMDHAGASVGQIVAVLLALWMFPYFHRLADAGASLVPADVFRWMYVFAAVPAALAVVAILFFVRETTADIKKKVQLDFRTAYDRRFWALMAALLVFALGNSSDMFLLLRAGQILKYPIQMTHAEAQTMAQAWNFPWQLPLMFFILNVSKMVFSMPGGCWPTGSAARRRCWPAGSSTRACTSRSVSPTSRGRPGRSSSRTASSTALPRACRRRSWPTSCGRRFAARRTAWRTSATGLQSSPRASFWVSFMRRRGRLGPSGSAVRVRQRRACCWPGRCGPSAAGRRLWPERKAV